MAQARGAYTDAKMGFADELVEEIDTLTKNPKYKTIKHTVLGCKFVKIVLNLNTIDTYTPLKKL